MIRGHCVESCRLVFYRVENESRSCDRLLFILTCLLVGSILLICRFIHPFYGDSDCLLSFSGYT
jgi:hypothetical protein